MQQQSQQLQQPQPQSQSPPPPQPEKQLLPCIIDVRTKANAYNNKMKGGGYEADGTYIGIRMFFTNVDDSVGIRDAYNKFIEGILSIYTRALAMEIHRR